MCSSDLRSVAFFRSFFRVFWTICFTQKKDLERATQVLTRARQQGVQFTIAGPGGQQTDLRLEVAVQHLAFVHVLHGHRDLFDWWCCCCCCCNVVVFVILRSCTYCIAIAICLIGVVCIGVVLCFCFVFHVLCFVTEFWKRRPLGFWIKHQLPRAHLREPLLDLLLLQVPLLRLEPAVEVAGLAKVRDDAQVVLVHEAAVVVVVLVVLVVSCP